MAKTSPYWLNSVLTARIRDSGFAEDGFSPRGLLKLFAGAGLGTAYGAYRPDLQPMRRRSSEETYDNHFIIDEHYLPTARALRKKARAFHRKYGLAQLDDLLASEERDGDTEQRILLEQMLHLDHHVWTASDGDEIWYLFEDTKHAIRSVCEKVLPVVGSCAAEELATACRRSLNARRNDPRYAYRFPPRQLIRRYLKTSASFQVVDGQVRHRQSRNATLQAIDRDLVAHLRTKPGGTSWPEIRTHLEEQGHKPANITRTIQWSPFLSVDKRRGRGVYTYSLLGAQTTDPASKSDAADESYHRCKERLERLSDTDFSTSTTQRKDQPILRDWLFDGNEEADCALCGKRYITSALVAAHKKKRERCSDPERRDPYIVMPLCRFGCDFVYEERYASIQDGVVEVGRHHEGSDAVVTYVDELVGRVVSDEWMTGKRSYFDDI